jgi:hypothetical protein
MSLQQITDTLSLAFLQAAPPRQDVRKSKKTPAPFCIRLSAQERAFLEEQAGSQSLGAYIRGQLLGEHAHKRRTLRRPKADEQALAQLLAALKSSRLSPNINQLAKAAHAGNLEVTEDVREQLEDARQALIAMRNTLFIALGLKPEGEQR